MMDPYAENRELLEECVLRGPGKTQPSLRGALAAGDESEIPEDLKALASKIEKHPIRITDAEFSALKLKYSEDELFEIVISTTLGASMRRLTAGIRALEEIG